MADFYKQKNMEMQNLTQKYVIELVQIWRRIFHRDVCIENLNKLVEHATNFYEELVAESKEKEEYVENEIKELKKEADNLRRLLNVDVVIKTTEDAPLFVVQAELDSSLAEMRETLRLRKEQVYKLLLEQESLCEELEELPRPLLDDPLPTEEGLQEFRQHLEKLKEERADRLNKVLKMRREIKGYLKTLELEVTSEAEDRLLNHRQIKLSKETLVGLSRMAKCYANQVQEVREKIEEMKTKLKSLWDRLDTSPRTRNKFIRYTEYTQSTFEAFYAELNRCQTLKSQNIKMYVNEIRKEIVMWWDKTLKSEVQRNRFSNFNSNCYTDDLLVLHEMELDDLKLFYESNKQIFELYDKRKQLWERMNALEAKANEPGRYNNRGGQLLKEEKERKMIATKLPKIEQRITELVKQYEEREQKAFLVYGENVLDVMARDWEQKRQAKELLSSARKQAQTPLSKSLFAVNRTPMSGRNVSTASARKAPTAGTTHQSGSATVALKRKLNAAEKVTVAAKRSLLHAINSPSMFLKPTNTAIRTPFKSPLKKTRLMTGAVRRRSGRLSSNVAKKRRSIKKNSSRNNHFVETDVSGEEGTYDSFEKFIEPAARSSIKPNSINSTANSSSARRVLRADSENIIPRVAQHHTSKTPPRNAHSPGAGSSRKLATKNLPIII